MAEEGFDETGTFPPAGWTIDDNGVGPAVVWQQATGVTTQPSYEGAHAAYLNKENVAVDIPEDWLITPQFNVPSNPQVRFFSRLSLGGDNGSLYRLMITDGDPTDLDGYTQVQEWTELEINPAQTVYTEIIADIPAGFVTSDVYVAFVMAGDNGDRWLVDNVSVVEQCLPPTDLGAENIGLTTADLTWNNPSAAGSWEIELIPAAAIPSGAGVVYDGDSPYNATALTESTEYKYYLRARCNGDGTNVSEWVGPFFFSTVALGATCEASIEIGALPYSATDNTSGYGDDYNGSPGATGCGSTFGYLNGDDVVYSYTAAADGTISIDMTDTGNYAGLFVYDDCADIGVACLDGGVGGFAGNPVSIPELAVTAGQTYYFVISTWAAPQSTDYTLTVQQVFCAPPVGEPTTGITQTSANLSWTNPSSATSWEIVVQTAGSGIPVGAGTTIATNTDYLADGLTESTLYEYYVRADCNDGNFSAWAGPYLFGTTCGALSVPFYEGFNSDSTTELCWTVLNVNDDNDEWNMDYAFNSFDGDQSAAITTDFNNGNNDDWLISPTLTLTGNQRLKFHQRVQSTFEPNDFEVLVSTTGADPADFTITLIPLATYNNNGYLEYIVNIVDGTNTAISGDVNIAWHVPNGGLDGWRLYIDNVIVEDIPSCPDPTDLTAGNFQPTSVDLSWTAGFNETDWEVVVQAPGTGEPTDATPVVDVTTDPEYTADGLTSNTVYEYYVRANCGVDDLSNWIGPFEFTTACDPFPVPFFEGFNTDSTTQNCWTVLNANDDNDTWNMDYAFNSFEGDQSAAITTDFNNGNNDDWLISPTITLTGNQRLKFHQRVQSAFEPNDFEVFVSTTGTDAANFTIELIPFASYGNTDYVEYIVNLVDGTNTPITGNVNIGWHVPADGLDGWRLYVDNVIVEDIPSCPDPTDLSLISAANISADIDWEPGFLETDWEIVVQAPGTGEPTDATPVVDVTGDSEHTAEGLTSNTEYEVYVRANCGVDDLSNWVGPITFTTACDPFPVPFFEGFNTDSETQNCWTVVNENGDNDSWNMDYAFNPYEGDQSAAITTDFNNGNNDDWLISPTILLTGNQRLKFHQRVQSGFEPNDFEVLLSTTGTAIADFTLELVPSAEYDNTDYIEYIVILDDAADALISGPVNIAWHVPNGGLDGWRLYIDNVIIQDIPTCPEPIDLDVVSVTTTSAELTWTSSGSEDTWEVVVQAPETGEPTDETEVTVVTENPPYIYEGLEPSTPYEFYVRAVCAEDDLSYWSGPFIFVTEIANDDCEDAIDIPVNAGFECDEFATGTITGATASGVAQTCSFGVPDYDVWYSFVAESTTHAISINNIQGGVFLQQVLFEGDDCGTLTQLSCGGANQSVTDLVVGNTYYVMVYANFFFDPTALTSFEVCVTTPAVPIGVNDTEYTIEELVQDVLIGVDCALVSNITSTSGSDFGQANSIGYFHDQDGTSPFPFSQGIVMATGGITGAPGPWPGNDTFDNGGWPGDADLSAIIAEGGNTGALNNATILEFDFVPFIDELSFNFLFASDEYGTFQCNFSDAFAFILTGPTTSVDGDNLAVIPGTTIPVSVVNIRDNEYNAGCESANEIYFDVFNQDNPNASTIGYNGQTVQMVASAAVTPGESYHIKLVIADYQDSAVNSAVFLDGGSFAIGAPDLGDDLTIEGGNGACAGDEIVLDTEMDPDTYDFQWFLDGEAIEDATEPSITVTESGDYLVEVIFENTNCSVDSEKTIEFFDPIVANEAQDLSACSTGEDITFDLTESLEGLMDDTTGFTFTFYATEEAAELGLDDNLPETYTTNASETIYIRISQDGSDCYLIVPFELTLSNIAGNFDPTSTDVSYSWMLGTTDLGLTTQSISVTDPGVYTVTVNNAGCVGTEEIEVTTIPVPVADVLTDVTACDSYTLEPLTVGNYFTEAGGAGTALAAGEVITSTQTIHIYATSGTTPECTDESSFVVTITPSPIVITPGDQSACDSYTLPALTVGNYYTEAGGAGTMLNEGDDITTTQTIYIYAETGTTPNCTDEDSFVVTITPSPVADVLADVTECNSYTLEPLTVGNYFTEAGGAGTALVAGDVITSTQTIHIYAETGTTPNCTDESSFVVTITPNPAFDLGGPYVACVASNLTVTVNATNFNTADATYAWTINGAPSTETGASIQATEFGTYEVTVDVNGCSTTQNIQVTQDTNAIAVMFEEGCEGGDYMITAMDIDGS
ncbi:MAG: hypothetical protein BM557_11250, partial [Flavobacterium sp. MedPE-SWcel]